MYNEDDYLMLSGIQHFLFCKRQWALIHIGANWDENEFTSFGQIVHKKTDMPFLKEKRRNLIISRAMPVSSKNLGLSGILDTIEFHKTNSGIKLRGRSGYWYPRIVEYKSGKSKKFAYDKAQLMAQAICIEEDFGLKLDYGYLYYHKTDSREKVVFDDDLRELVIKTSQQMHKYYEQKIIPKASFYRKCSMCSINEICKPRLSKKPKSVYNYIYGEDL